MRYSRWMATISAGLGLFCSSLYAGEVVTEQLQLPQCLAAKLTKDYPILAENNNYRIIEVPLADIDSIVLLADEEKCGRFINVSTHFKKSMQNNAAIASQLLKKPAAKAPLKSRPYEIKHPSEVFRAIEQVGRKNIMATLNHLTSYKNRSATKDTGVEAAQWLKTTFEDMAKQYNRTDTNAYFVKTRSPYKQPSLVTVIGKDIKAPAVVIGAHMDTLDGIMPGAGDDGSGSSSVMEMARVLLSSDLQLKRPVYFIWYAAEERGLIGSQHVVDHFMVHAIPVRGVIQFDMTGFRNDRNDPTMWVYRDYTDPDLTDFVADLIKVYIGVPVAESKCGYGCSDHATWMEESIPAAFPCETDFENHNTKIHTSGDTVDRLTPEHMVNFTKLGLAFAVELGLE
ncbi:aminopeptidase LapA [Legionella dresdenensis]|uniref:Aminopeptidase LapA n=1 Tax=Legionella dresdenensis TaxID=450200 RepID=A0ABV8CI62_9GAMM